MPAYSNSMERYPKWKAERYITRNFQCLFFIGLLTCLFGVSLVRLHRGLSCHAEVDDQTGVETDRQSLSFLGDEDAPLQKPAKLERKALARKVNKEEEAVRFSSVPAALEHLVSLRRLPKELVWKDVDTFANVPLRITTFYSSHCLQYRLPKKRAFVMGHDFSRPYNMSAPQSRKTLELLRLFHPLEDIIFYTLKKNMDALRAMNEASIQEFNLKVVGFEVPPVSETIKESLDNTADCCPGDNEYLKLNVFGLDMYDAVIFLDNDQRVLGNLDIVFRCAAKYFVSTTGQGEALNGGFFAFKPSRDLYEDISYVLQYANYDKDTGFNNTGYGHHDNVDRHLEFYSSAGPQGFFWYYFYLLPIAQKKGTVQVWRQEGAHMIRCEVNGMCDYMKGLRNTIKYPCLNYPNPPLILHKYCSGIEYGDADKMPFGFLYCVSSLAQKIQRKVSNVNAESD